MNRTEYEKLKTQSGYRVSRNDYENLKKNQSTNNNEKVTLAIQEGTEDNAKTKEFGTISRNAYRAISNGLLDYYNPVDDEEKKVIDKYKNYIGYGKTIDTVTSQYNKDKFGKGNIDLTQRPVYTNPDGKISTVDSISIGEDGKEIVIPTIVKDENGKAKRLTTEEAIEHYHKTGEYLGKFNTREEADDYAQSLHIDQMFYYSNPNVGQENDKREMRDANFWDVTINSIKRGYVQSVYGQESYKAMMGFDNKKDEYEKKLNSEDYSFIPDSKVEEWVSGAMELLGQQVRQWTDTRSLSAGAGAATATFIAGQAGPQVIAPEEVVTVPTAFVVGLQAGSATANFEIEAGHAYNEMVEQGISPKTAKMIALGVGAGNAALEALQVDDLIKSAKILTKINADSTITKKLLSYLAGRGIHIARETTQEVAQESVTLMGVDLARGIEGKDAVYSWEDVGKRIGNTAVSSAMSFAMLGTGGDAINYGKNKATSAFDNREKNVRMGKYLRDTDIVQSVVDTGLESPKDSTAYKLAEKAQLKLNKKDKLSDYEVGKLYYANVEQIKSEEQSARETAKTEETTPAEVSSATVSEKETIETPVATEQRNTFTEELDEIASTEMPSVSVGETFVDSSTNNVLKVVGRDDTTTTIELTTPNGKKETLTRPNHGADTLAVDDRYTKVETSAGTPTTESAVETAEETVTPQTETPKNITLTRIGDFYESYGDEAVEIANKLNLTLTSKTINGEKVQMVGFPVSSFEKYKNALGDGYNITIADTPTVTNTNAENTETTDVVTPTETVAPQAEMPSVKVGDVYEAGGKTYTITGRENGRTTYTLTDKNGGKTISRETSNVVADINFTKEDVYTKVKDGQPVTSINEENMHDTDETVSNNEVVASKDVDIQKKADKTKPGLNKNDLRIFKKAYNLRYGDVNGQKYITDGSVVIAVDENEANAAIKEYEEYNDRKASELDLGPILSACTSSPEFGTVAEIKSFEADKKIVACVVNDIGFSFKKDYVNLLKKRGKTIKALKVLSDGTFKNVGSTILVSYDENGNLVGLALAIKQERETVDGIKMFTGKGLPNVETPVSKETKVKTKPAKTETVKEIKPETKTTDEPLQNQSESATMEEKETSVEETPVETYTPKEKEDFEVGDVLEFDGEQWECARIDTMMIDFVNVDKNAFNDNMSVILPYELFKEKTDYRVIKKPANETSTQTKGETIEKDSDKTVSKNKGTKQIADYVANKLAKGEKISSLELQKIATEAFGGTMANNAFTIKDAYDALELGVNQHILSMKEVSAEKMLELLELLPTQTKRTEEMVKFQQFSTPPSIAYLANYTANVNANDIMLEPSAGIGGIAVFAKKDGATVYVNELDNRRLDVLKNMPFDGFYNEDAEQINNILGGELKPTVIVMNPPFSSSSERNMKNTKIGAKHIEQALKILAPNGRLVAIVGKGMADGEPAFRNWWKDIKSQYNVKANIGINGKNYNKYGTNFDIQMLVIDKNGPTTDTVTGYVDTLQELQEKLGGIRDERPAIDYSANEQRTPATTRKETTQTGKSTDRGNSTLSDTSSGTDSGKSAVKRGTSGKSVNQDIQSTDTEHGKSNIVESENTDVVVDEDKRVGSRQSDGLVGEENTTRTDNGDSGQSDVQTRRTEPRNRVKRTELTDSIFEQYQPQPLRVKNAQPHPARVSESAAMSAIEPPVITYKPNIPQDIIDKGVVSDVQLEAISYAGQSHSQTLPNGTTRGFFLGDGTGIGKGRTIAGMILDNYNQGRKKAVWVTLNSSLVNDAKRDVNALFGSPDLVTQFVGGNKADSVLNTDEAIMVISYSALSKGFDNKDSNFEKLVKWLGKDFDGLIVFDEAHKMGNATSTKGTRGMKKASQTGIAGIALQEALPKAKIVYSSATGATEVENLRYAERLGLWGEGTPFIKGDDFVSNVKAGGLAAMELIARDMKAMGVYLSRNISYDDVQYDKITHNLTPQQTKIYDELASSWQIVLQNINKALENTNQDKDGHARGRALGAFWSSQQRFFNQILTSMQVPSVISDIEQQLADGKSCVIQLVSTNEAAQNQEFERLKSEDLELDEFDLTPKQVLMSLIENSFPVQQFEEYRDDKGNVRSRPVFDSKGNPVINREAVEQRDELLAKLGSIKVPSSPIDMIINHFGTDLVAENTGRARRVIQKDGKTIEEKIGSKKDADVDAFQNGKKRIIIFSKAGGTGKSYHADKAAKNQQQRVHYLLEAGWQADNAVQGFGRSHRSNQASAPIFKLVTTNLKGQMRFISTIAKRLDQLGAMTKGQRQAGSQGMFSASDNLENSFAADVLATFYKDLLSNRVDGIDSGIEILEKLGLKDKILDEYNRIIPTAPELREVNKFLNRILSLESAEQNTVFEGYSLRLQDATERAMQAGTLDKGLENYKADKITLNEVQDIREDETSGAKTKYYNLTAEHKIKPIKFDSVPTDLKSFAGFYQNKNTGAVRAVFQTSSTTDKYGNVTSNYKLLGQVKNEYIPQHRFYGNWNKLEIADAEKLWGEEVLKLPEYRQENLHLISGVVLPVWDKLPTENVRIYRVLTSDGEMLIGRVVSEDMIDETLRRLGSARKKEKIATKDLIAGIKNGDTVHLENGWKIVQRKVAGENRIEIVGPSYEHHDLLKEKGVFTERIQYNTRYFVPADTNTEKIIDDVLKISPVMHTEKAKYSIESEGLSDEARNDLLSGNSDRGSNASTRKQAKRISDFKQKLKGKTKAERKSFAKELLAKGQTEEITDGNHQFNIVKPEAYNDDMLSIIEEAKATGKEVGFFIGHGKRKFTDLKIDAAEYDNKVYLRYDGVFSPQTLLKHEDVHIEWNNPEMQKAKDIIRNDLSESEKKKILAEDRYKQYMSLYNGDKDAVWQEFVADVFAGMNDYTADYIDTVVDYWYDGKVVDRYSPAEYAESIDAGGNETVLDGVGFGDEYKLSVENVDNDYVAYDSTAILKESTIDYYLRAFASDGTPNYAQAYITYMTPRDFLELTTSGISSRLHIENESRKLDKDNFEKATHYQPINLTIDHKTGEVISHEGRHRMVALSKENIYDVPVMLFDSSNKTSKKNLNDFKLIGQFNEYHSAIVNEAIPFNYANRDLIIEKFGTQSKDQKIRERLGINETFRYSTSVDDDSAELTPERKKEILEQFERDRAGIDKPTQKQIWGERAEWIAHNMTRVFPEIPERGEKGVFFAEFRKMMIQWKALPQTSMFMTQDKLNQMTKDLTPDEFKTFSELVYFLDLQEEAQIQKERGYEEILLPNGISPHEVDQIVEDINKEATDNVKKALEKRRQIWDNLKEQYITLNQYIGFDTGDKFKRKNYYHHQVIEYMNQGGKGVAKGKDIEIKAGRGWLKERHGSTEAINTDFLAVEYKAMLQMQYDIYVANMLGKIKDQYDIKPQLEKQAFNNNKKLLNDIIKEEATDDNGNVMLDNKGNPDSETYRQQQWYNQRIMFGFSGLFDLAQANMLPTFNGQYGNVIRALENRNLNAPGLYNYVGELASMELSETATDEETQARISARTVLKYTSQKKAWVKEILADDYQTWETLANDMKDTHSIHQPRRGNYFYTKTTVDEDAFTKAFNDMIVGLVAGENGVDTTADMKKLFEQYSETIRLEGAAYEQWVIPNEIETTMNKVANPQQASVVSQVSRALLSAWKGWATSVNPLRTVKFGIRNMFGDLDAVIAGNPKVVLYAKQAVTEIYQAMKHKKYTPEFMNWVERGGYSSLIFANEMDTEMQDKLFAHLKDKEGLNIFKIPAKLFEGYYNGVETAHNFREAILRYSAYLYFKNDIVNNGGKVKDNVASNRYIIQGLQSVEDKAYQLSKDLLGAYDEVGAMGQALRRHAIPFYSFTETNLKRYYRLFENIIMSDDKIPKKAGKLLLKALMVNALSLLMVAWNRLVMKDDDDELPPSVRNVPHITLGKIGDDVYAFRQLGSFSELLEWVGFEDYQWTKEDLTAPLDKAVGMITPVAKTPVELLTGLNFYPSITQPRAIRDKVEHLFSTLGVDDVYRVVAGKPTKGIGDIVKGAVTYTYDYKESAYYEILDIKREYQGDTDNTIYGQTPKSNALYYMKTAIRYKDKETALKYLDEYFENGGTAKGITQSIAMLNPLYGYTSKDTIEKGQAFVNSLSDDEKDKLRIAINYYENDLMLPEEVSALLRKKGITDEQAKNLLIKYINSKCK